ncbi:MAG: hypothetical protein MUF29_05540, partial [Chitinophagaceae bacterium]|nr:hypothetical protein [Chitinophagaceae bacterium]
GISRQFSILHETGSGLKFEGKGSQGAGMIFHRPAGALDLTKASHAAPGAAAGASKKKLKTGCGGLAVFGRCGTFARLKKGQVGVW